jgi:hypothetical protein
MIDLSYWIGQLFLQLSHWIGQHNYAGFTLSAFVLVSCTVFLYDVYKGTVPASYAQNPRWLMGALALAGIVLSVWMLFGLFAA